MSARKLPISLTRRAQRDIERLLVHTEQQWGEEQRYIYAHAIDRALKLLGDNPNIGRLRDDLRSAYRVYPIEQHLILYRITSRSVSISRVLHRRMDVRSAMQDRP